MSTTSVVCPDRPQPVNPTRNSILRALKLHRRRVERLQATVERRIAAIERHRTMLESYLSKPTRAKASRIEAGRKTMKPIEKAHPGLLAKLSANEQELADLLARVKAYREAKESPQVA
jgi:hypothetical protein